MERACHVIRYFNVMDMGKCMTPGPVVWCGGVQEEEDVAPEVGVETRTAEEASRLSHPSSPLIHPLNAGLARPVPWVEAWPYELTHDDDDDDVAGLAGGLRR